MSASDDLDALSTEELVRLSLIGDLDDDAGWEAVRALHKSGTREVFEAAARLLASESPRERARGADILGQLGISTMGSKQAFPAEQGDLLMAQLAKESSPEVLLSICYALGHLKEARAVPLVAALRTHSSEDVRLSVVHGLSCQEDPVAIRALIELSGDSDRDVRNWATFALGSMVEADSPSLRHALVLRLAEDDLEIQGEAIKGLVHRQDPRGVKALEAALAAETVNGARSGGRGGTGRSAVPSAATQPPRGRRFLRTLPPERHRGSGTDCCQSVNALAQRRLARTDSDLRGPR